jgi:lipoprotein NlpD
VAAAPPLPAATAVEAERAPAATAPPAASAPQPAPERVASIAPGPSRAAAGLAWRWPARGTVVSRFLPGDPARQGINLQGKPGETVAAVADGDVVYSGNGLVGYGELIIVKHSAELLSAYGGSGKRLVTEGTKVKSGQALAEVAGNGIVHFEIRRAGKPVDPLEYLPQR